MVYETIDCETWDQIFQGCKTGVHKDVDLKTVPLNGTFEECHMKILVSQIKKRYILAS